MTTVDCGLGVIDEGVRDPNYDPDSFDHDTDRLVGKGRISGIPEDAESTLRGPLLG